MSDTSNLLAALAAIQKQNKPKFKKVPALTHYTGTAPAKHTSVVNPKTSKGSTKDGGILSGIKSVAKNLGSDVEDTVRGIPGGIIQTAHHPIATVKAVGADYKHRYSPLVHGDFGTFAHEVGQHPLAPLLDVLSVASGGGALAAKVGQSAKVAETIDAARTAQAAKVASKVAERTAPIKASVASLTKRVEKVKVDRDMAATRVDKAAATPDVQMSSVKAFQTHSKTIKSIQDEITRQSKKVTKIEKKTQAAPLSTPVRALVRLQDMTAGETKLIGAKDSPVQAVRVAVSHNPVKRLRQSLGLKVQEHVLPSNTPLIGLNSRVKKAANLQRQGDADITRAPKRRVVAAMDHMARVGGKDKGLTDAMATATQGLIDGVAPKDYARLVKDTRSTQHEIDKSLKKGLTPKEHHAHTEQLIAPHLSTKAADIYEGAKQFMQREALEAGKSIDPIHLQRVRSKLIDSPEVGAVVKLQKAHAEAATDAMRQLVQHKLLEPDVASQQAVLHVNLVRAVKGLPDRTPEATIAAYEKAGLPAPVYNPDALTIGEAGSKRSMLKESQGKLYTRGTRVNSPMNIVMRHELASKATDVKQTHLLLLSTAKKISAGDAKPKGWVWIQDALPKTLTQKEALFKQQTEDGVALGSDYFKMLESEKRPNGGYAMPKHMFEDLVGGRAAMVAARGGAAAKAMQAWKFMVLFRPAFLVHNVLSNQAMFHLKSGWGGPAFANMRKAFKSGVFDEHHHAEGHTTFGTDAQIHAKTPLGKKVTGVTGVFYKLVGQHEHWLRELSMYETARRMPEVRREMRALKGGKFDPAQHGGRTMFHEAYNRAVAKAPHVRDLVNRNMDDTLGNYRYYTQQERMLKNISPFYGWERHSVRNMIRMMEDNPATMAMLTQIGMVGHDKFNKDFGPGMPDFVKNYVQDSYIQTLASAVGLKGVSMYDFNSTNPWTTAVDVGKAATGDKASLVGLAGPAITAPIEEFTGKSVLTGAPTNSRFSNPIAGMADRVVTSTPPVSLWDALTSQKNEKKKLIKTTDEGVIVNNLGGDFRNLDKARAKKMEAAKHVLRDKYGNPIKKKGAS